MFIYYKLSGSIANFALIWNILLVLSVLASLGATLTLPGIAALILTVGMSIDANVIIFERIREELRKGKTRKAAIDAGNQSAWGLVAAVGGVPNGWTHAFVNVYETAEDLANSASNWDPSSVLGIDQSLLNTVELTDGGFSFQNWAVQTSLSAGERTTESVTIWNFSRPKNLAGFINENKTLWKKQFENDMGGRISWGVGLKLNNRSQNLSTVMTWDRYPSLADALQALNQYEGGLQRGSKMDEYDPDGWSKNAWKFSISMFL